MKFRYIIALAILAVTVGLFLLLVGKFRNSVTGPALDSPPLLPNGSSVPRASRVGENYSLPGELADELDPKESEERFHEHKRRAGLWDPMDMSDLPRSLTGSNQWLVASNYLYRQQNPIYEVRRVSITEAFFGRSAAKLGPLNEETNEIGHYYATNLARYPIEQKLTPEELRDLRKYQKTKGVRWMLHVGGELPSEKALFISERVAQISFEGSPFEANEQELAGLFGTNWINYRTYVKREIEDRR